MAAIYESGLLFLFAVRWLVIDSHTPLAISQSIIKEFVKFHSKSVYSWRVNAKLKLHGRVAQSGKNKPTGAMQFMQRFAIRFSISCSMHEMPGNKTAVMTGVARCQYGNSHNRLCKLRTGWQQMVDCKIRMEKCE